MITALETESLTESEQLVHQQLNHFPESLRMLTALTTVSQNQNIFCINNWITYWFSPKAYRINNWTTQKIKSDSKLAFSRWEMLWAQMFVSFKTI